MRWIKKYIEGVTIPSNIRKRVVIKHKGNILYCDVHNVI